MTSLTCSRRPGPTWRVLSWVTRTRYSHREISGSRGSSTPCLAGGAGQLVQFDTVGKEYSFPALADYSNTFWFPSDRVRAQALKALMDAGIGDLLLLSQDVCSKVDLLRYGGFGYGHILRTFARDVEEAGVAAEDVRRMSWTTRGVCWHDVRPVRLRVSSSRQASDDPQRAVRSASSRGM